MVAVIHEGAFLGRGGNGASGALLPNYSLPGQPGGDAMHITVRTYLYLRNGYILGGGGGGASAGVEQQYTTPSLPVIGSQTFTIGVSAGGGGGAQSGRGGTPSGNFQVGYFSPGQDATSGLTAQAGRGGLLSRTISQTVGPFTVNVTPQGFGGKGGEYGYPGERGYVHACIQVIVNINIPLVGSIPIPINAGCLPPGGVQLAQGGASGYAIKRIGGAVLYPYHDGPYITSFIRGYIGQ